MLVFGKYEVIRRLAIGGMGEIFMARQKGVPGFDRLVILKNLLPELARKREHVEQFLDEARVGATLNHPNIVSIYEVGLWEGAYFIAMEYIDGENLAELLISARELGTAFPFPVAARIVHDAALGLDYAHHATGIGGEALNLVHRDISPHNLMARSDGVTKVVDFGIAKAASRALKTRTGVVKGKLMYMAPEQINGLPLDGRADQFALGAVLWELCTGQRLFGADNEFHSAEKILSGPIKPPSEVTPAIPPTLETIIMRMVERDRDRRYPRLRDVAQALGEYTENLSREAGHPAVAAFVASLVGDELRDRAGDITPRDDQFLIELRSDTAKTVDYGSPGRAQLLRFAKLRSGALVLASLALVAAVVWSLASRDTAVPTAGAQRTPVPHISAHDQAATPAAPRTELTPVAPSLAIDSTPRGATVRSGTAVLGTTPLEVNTLAPDVRHVLRIEKRGYTGADQEISLRAGDRKHLHVELTRAPRRPATSPRGSQPPLERPDTTDGYLTINTSPWTKVAIDGAPYGATPIFKLRLTPGTHTVRLVNEQASIDIERRVDVGSGEITKVDLKLD